MAGKTIVILGGGVGGLVTANELRERLGKEHRVILVDREGRHIFWPSLLWVQVGLRDPDKIVRDLARLEKKGIEVLKGEVESIDPERKTVRVDNAELAADYVVISLGAQLAPEKIPGLAEGGHNLYSLEGATAIRDSLKKVDEGRVVVLTAGIPYKCPAAPYEAGHAPGPRPAQAQATRPRGGGRLRMGTDAHGRDRPGGLGRGQAAPGGA